MDRESSTAAITKNNRQELKYCPHVTVPDQQTATFTRVNERLILNIQSEILNESDISESIRKGVILDLSKEISIKMISTEEEPSRAEL